MSSGNRKKKRGGFLWTLLIVVFGAVFVFSGIKLYGILTEYHEGVEIYEEVRESYAELRVMEESEPSRKEREQAKAAAQSAAEESAEAAPEEESDAPVPGTPEEETDPQVPGTSEEETDTPASDAPEEETDTAASDAPEEETDVPEPGIPEEETDVPEPGIPEEETDAPSSDAPEEETDTAASDAPEEKTDAPASDAPVPGTAQEETESAPAEPAWYASFTQDYSDHEHPQKLDFLHTTIDFLLIPRYVFDFGALLRLNPEVCGWIMIKDTYVDYPVVKGTDNVFYLRHAVGGELNNAGSVFADFRHTAPFYEKNTVIYAHNQRNLRMFHQLLSYQKKEYMEAHPYVDIYLPDGTMQVYRVYSCHVETGTESYKIGFADTEAFDRFIRYTQESALYDSYVPVFADDRILTLVTCTDEADEKRVVIHAVFVEQTRGDR